MLEKCVWVNVFQNYVLEQEGSEIETGNSVYVGVISPVKKNLIIVTNCFPFVVTVVI